MIRKVLLSFIISMVVISAVFAEGLSVFKFNNQYGYVNEKLEVVIPAIYNRVDPFNEYGYAIVQYPSYPYLREIIDISGKTVLSDSNIQWGSNIYDDWYILGSGSKTILLNVVTKEYASDQYSYSVQSSTDTDLIPASIPIGENEWEMGYVTTKGDVVFSNKDFWTRYGFRNGRAVVGNREGYSAIINESGEYITDYVIDGGHIYFSEDLLAVKLADSAGGQTGYMNRNGEMEFFVPIAYFVAGGKGGIVLDATPFSGGYALIKTSKEPDIWRVINNNGEFVSEELSIEPSVTAGLSGFRDGYCCVVKYDTNRKLCYSYIDTSGKELTGFIFESAEDFVNGYARIVYQGREGLLDVDGNVYWSDEFINGNVIPRRIE